VFSKENIAEKIFLAVSIVSILAVVTICIFLFANGIPAIGEIGILDFLFGTKWQPSNNIYGIFPMIVGSIYITGLSLLLGVPISIMTSVFISFFCPRRLYIWIKPSIELLAGIPSIVFGFFGMTVLVPFVRVYFAVTEIVSLPPQSFWQ